MISFIAGAKPHPGGQGALSRLRLLFGDFFRVISIKILYPPPPVDRFFTSLGCASAAFRWYKDAKGRVCPCLSMFVHKKLNGSTLVPVSSVPSSLPHPCLISPLIPVSSVPLIHAQSSFQNLHIARARDVWQWPQCNSPVGSPRGVQMVPHSIASSFRKKARLYAGGIGSSSMEHTNLLSLLSWSAFVSSISFFAMSFMVHSMATVVSTVAGGLKGLRRSIIQERVFSSKDLGLRLSQNGRYTS